MKYFTTCFVLLLFFKMLNAQTPYLLFDIENYNKHQKISEYYQKGIDSLNIGTRTDREIEIKNLWKLINSENLKANPDRGKIVNWKKNIENLSYIFNDQMLNILFNSEVSSYFNGSSDLSTQRYYVTLDADDNSFSFGYNTRLGSSKNKLNKLNWLLSLGLKVKSSNRFSEVYKDGDFLAKDAGLTIKFTKINRGTIDFTGTGNYDETTNTYDRFDRGNIIKKYRKEYLYEKIDTEVQKYIDGQFQKDVKNLKRFLDNDQREKSKDIIKKFKKAKIEEYYAKIAEEEIKYIKENDLYRSFEDHWLTLEFFIPFADNTYNIVDAAATESYTKTFYPFSASAAYTFFKKWSTGQSFYIIPKFSIFNNNPIVAGGLNTTTIQTNELLTGGIVLVSSEDVYNIEDYKNFETGKAELEIVTFLVKDIVGLSPAVEFNFGKYDAINWKLGIPVSLKDKEGKPTINFELQWKGIETFNGKLNHFVGISANFLFGKFLN